MVNVYSTLTAAKTVCCSVWLMPKLNTRCFLAFGIAAIITKAAINIYSIPITSGKEFIPTEPESEIDSIHWILKQQLKKLPSMTIRAVSYLKLKTQLYAHSLLGNNTINFTSSLIERHTSRPPIDLRRIYLDYRDTFRTFTSPSSSIHTHSQSAAFRSAMNSFMTSKIHASGHSPYHVSAAKTDSHMGSRYFYTIKDLGIDFRNDVIPTNAVIVMTDVDYYADMNRWLALNLPILMYTLVPTKMTHRTAEYAYHFEGDELVYTVRGGATYKHKLWVYEGDTLAALDQQGNLLVYSVEQRLVPHDEEHRYVCLLPVAKVNYPYSLLMDYESVGLKRYHNEGYKYEPITDTISISVDSKHQSVETTGQIYEAIKQRMLNKTAPPIIADVERILRDSGEKNSQINAPLLFNHVSKQITRNVILTTALNSFHPLTGRELTNDDGQPTGETATSNLVYPGGCYPTNSEASDHATIIGRIERPRNNVTPPRHWAELDTRNEANNFLSQLLRHRVNNGYPWDVSRVAQEQDGIQQRARLNASKATMTTLSTNQIKCFIKAEAYSTANDPRNISTMTPDLTTLMSGFTYAFKEEVLKHQPFYSPGLTPNEIIKRLGDITKEDGIVVTDYSRFDGSISQWLQDYIVKAAYMRWAHPSQREELSRWFGQVFKQSAKTTHHITFNPGYGTRSGSPITTDGNTLINAFVIYLAFRSLGSDIRTAYKQLGLYCGDDGYTPYAHGLVTAIAEASRILGLKVDVEHKKTGPYPYCGRLFLDPQVRTDSHQDMRRTLPKLHMVSRSSLSIEQRITNKAAGYLVTDRNTPIIGIWAKKILALTKLQPQFLTHEEIYKLSRPWPQEDPEALMESACQQLQMTSNEIKLLERMIEDTATLTDLPVLTEWNENTKITAVRGGVIEYPSRSHNESNHVQRSTHQATRATTGSTQRQQHRGRQRGGAVHGLSTMVDARGRGDSQSSDRAGQPTPPLHRQVEAVRPSNTRDRRQQDQIGRNGTI